MHQLLKKNITALITLFVFVLGNGFLSTFIATQLTQQDYSSLIIGLMTTAFYAGLVLGSFQIERFIVRVAHIRAYAAFASLVTVTCLFHIIFDDIFIWLLLRFVCGFGTAGVFIVIESWLLSQSTYDFRGRVLALYMLTFYAAQALGQLFLGLDDVPVVAFFALIAILSSLSVIPLTLTKAESPQFNEPSILKLGEIYRNCASGLFGCFIAGLILSSLYGLLPTYLIYQFNDLDSVAKGMFFIIFGGMILQYPIGKLSDIVERRIVLLAIGACTILICLVMVIIPHSLNLFLVLCVLLGGFAFTIYPVSISHACDNLAPSDIVAGTQTLLLTYSIGAMFGPIIAPLFMKIHSDGLLIYIISTAAILVLAVGWRRTVKENEANHEEAFISYPQNTPISAEVDPRGENPSVEDIDSSELSLSNK